MSYTRGYVAPAAGALVVDLGRMDRILAIDPVDMLVTVEAGCTWAALYEALKPLGPDYVSMLAKATAGKWMDPLPRPGKKSGAYMNPGAAFDVPVLSAPKPDTTSNTGSAKLSGNATSLLW